MNPDFPLRRFVRCAPCGSPLTGYFARGRHGGRFGYYRCAACNGVSIRREALDDAFVALLDSVALRPDLLALLRADVIGEWRRLNAEATTARETRDRQLRALREKRSRLVDAYLARDVDPETYRAKASELDDAVAFAAAGAVDAAVGEIEVQAALGFAEHVLGRPGAFWREMTALGKRGFAEVVFPAGVHFDPKKGFANPTLSPIFNHLRPEKARKSGLVAPAGQPANPLPALLALFRAARAA
jgi:site-specific DNA recombinase